MKIYNKILYSSNIWIWCGNIIHHINIVDKYNILSILLIYNIFKTIPYYINIEYYMCTYKFLEQTLKINTKSYTKNTTDKLK